MMDLTLQDLGSIGELIGGVVVVISLVFVGVQLRQNYRAIRESNELARIESLDESRRSFSQWRRDLAEDPELARLWLAGLSGELTDENDRFRFEQLKQELLFLNISAYDRYIHHGQQQRAKAMARGMATLIHRHPGMKGELLRLPGTDAFFEELEKQIQALR